MDNTTPFGDKLKTAITNSNFTQGNYVWKGRKVRNADGSFTQETVNLMDATEEQLRSFMDHCMSMLYNKSSDRPGRKPLLNIVQEQRDKCGVELFLRESEANGASRYTIVDSIRQVIKNSELTQKDLKGLVLSDFLTVSSQYQSLPIELVQDGCLYKLGKFDKSHITKTFILKQGLKLTERDEAELRQDGEEKVSVLDLVRTRLDIRDHMPLRVDPKGLTFTQLKAMWNLRDRYYSDLSAEQLKTLRNHLLFALEDDVLFHIEQWENRIGQIQEVAELRGVEV